MPISHVFKRLLVLRLTKNQLKDNECDYILRSVRNEERQEERRKRQNSKYGRN